MTLDELEADHLDYQQWVNEEWPEAKVEKPKLVPIQKKGPALSNNIPEATKIDLLALKDGVCAKCGGTCGCYVFENMMLFYCHAEPSHRFKETINWS